MTMCEDLDTQAENYMRSVMNNDGDVFTRSDLYEYIIEAYKQGRKDELNKLYDVIGLKPYIDENQLTEEDCQRTIDILNQTREGCRKASENIKDLTKTAFLTELKALMKRYNVTIDVDGNECYLDLLIEIDGHTIEYNSYNFYIGKKKQTALTPDNIFDYEKE